MIAIRLKRTRQCAHCPWRKDVIAARDVPNYNAKKHNETLRETIAVEGDLSAIMGGAFKVMACHETDDAHCLGWLMNQMGPGNNIALRMDMMRCENFREVRLIGKQHECFEDTIV